jgi:large subunit ribosomal protein L10
MRPEKSSILQEITQRVESADFVFVIKYGGLKVAELTELRRLMATLQTKVLVVKNAYLNRVAIQLGWESMAPYLSGSTALLAGKGDASEVAKALMKFVKAHEKAAIKGVCLNGKALGIADVDALSKVPPREVMLGLFVGTLAAPMMQLVGVFNQKVLSLLYVLKAVEEKKSKAA